MGRGTLPPPSRPWATNKRAACCSTPAPPCRTRQGGADWRLRLGLHGLHPLPHHLRRITKGEMEEKGLWGGPLLDFTDPEGFRGWKAGICF